MRLCLVESAEVMLVFSEYSSICHGRILPRDIHGVASELRVKNYLEG
jgi:hypothetical protein